MKLRFILTHTKYFHLGILVFVLSTTDPPIYKAVVGLCHRSYI